MLSSAPPSKIPVPFANSGTKNTIPTASQIGVTPGAASLTDGFPPLTFTPLEAGGIAPAGADMNGILNRVTAIQQWQSSGGMFAYDAAQSTAIGGYPKGAMLVKADGSGYWQSIVESNTTNPDASGAGWIDAGSGRLLNVRVFGTPGTSTYTPTPGTNSIIVEAVGGGGSGGGCAATGAGQVSAGASGGAGAYIKGRWTTGFSGAPITIGAGGAAASGGAANNGTVTSLGSLFACPGGNGGQYAGPSTPPLVIGGAMSSAPTGTANIVSSVGAAGGVSMALSASVGLGAPGASSVLGGGGSPSSINTPGIAATAPGAGGGGSMLGPSQSAIAGGAGAPGLMVIYEFS